MHEAVKIIAVEAGWRLCSLLRSQRYFSVPSLVHLYKSLVLSYLESCTAAIYHTADSVIERIDRIQDRLLVRCRLTALEEFSRFNLAPLPTRRDIAMLGILHKVVLGVAPPGISSIFPKGPITCPLAYPLRIGFHLNRPSHNRQLLTPCTRLSTEKFKRSIFGIVSFYNALPQWVVDVP